MSAAANEPSEEILGFLRKQGQAGNVRVTQHANQEMVAEAISLDDVLDVLTGGEMLENYPDHRRGPCALLNGRTRSGRPLHVVCATTGSVPIIITAYEPLPPKWTTPWQRRT